MDSMSSRRFYRSPPPRFVVLPLAVSLQVAWATAQLCELSTLNDSIVDVILLQRRSTRSNQSDSHAVAGMDPKNVASLMASRSTFQSVVHGEADREPSLGDMVVPQGDMIAPDVAPRVYPPHMYPYDDSFGWSVMRQSGSVFFDLHLMGVSLNELRKDPFNSLSGFLLQLRKGLSKAGDVPATRITILGIHEQYKRINQDEGFVVIDEGDNASAPMGGADHTLGIDKRTGLEVVVNVAVMKTEGPGLHTKEVIEGIRAALSNSSSEGSSLLHHGLLKRILRGSFITRWSEDGDTSDGGPKPMTEVYPMIFSIGISAFLTGMLIWIAF